LVKFILSNSAGKLPMKQQTLTSLTCEVKKKRTKREKFLNEMEQVVPWERLMGLIEPHYPKAGKGRQPMGLTRYCGFTACSNGTACPTLERTRR
jgi:hypothetical protein